jgi:hypothetical protein
MYGSSYVKLRHEFIDCSGQTVSAQHQEILSKTSLARPSIYSRDLQVSFPDEELSSLEKDDGIFSDPLISPKTGWHPLVKLATVTSSCSTL